MFYSKPSFNKKKRKIVFEDSDDDVVEQKDCNIIIKPHFEMFNMIISFK